MDIFDHIQQWNHRWTSRRARISNIYVFHVLIVTIKICNITFFKFLFRDEKYRIRFIQNVENISNWITGIFISRTQPKAASCSAVLSKIENIFLVEKLMV